MLSSIENLFQPDVQEADKHTAAAKPPAAAPKAVQPVATPCRSAGPEPPSDPHHPKTATPSEPTSAPHDPEIPEIGDASAAIPAAGELRLSQCLSLIHISEPTRRVVISYAVFCLKKK